MLSRPCGNGWLSCWVGPWLRRHRGTVYDRSPPMPSPTTTPTPEPEAILCCPRHLEYRVPLIFTFAFPGAEYWCPFCGYKSGIFGAGEQVPATSELAARYEVYHVAALDYLRSRGAGEWAYRVPSEELPAPDQPPGERPSFACQGCGKVAPAQVEGGSWVMPRHWYSRQDADGRQVACSRDCVRSVAERTGKTAPVMPW